MSSTLALDLKNVTRKETDGREREDKKHSSRNSESPFSSPSSPLSSPSSPSLRTKESRVLDILAEKRRELENEAYFMSFKTTKDIKSALEMIREWQSQLSTVEKIVLDELKSPPEAKQGEYNEVNNKLELKTYSYKFRELLLQSQAIEKMVAQLLKTASLEIVIGVKEFVPTLEAFFQQCLLGNQHGDMVNEMFLGLINLLEVRESYSFESNLFANIVGLYKKYPIEYNQQLLVDLVGSTQHHYSIPPFFISFLFCLATSDRGATGCASK